MKALIVGGLLLAAEKLPGSCLTACLLVCPLLASLEPPRSKRLQLRILLPRQCCTKLQE